MERLGNLSSGFARWEEMTWGFLLAEHEALTWARAGLYPLMAEREAQWVGGGERGATKLLSCTGEQGTGDALPPSDMKPSSLLGSLLSQGAQLLLEAVPAWGENPFLCLQSTQN